LNLYLLTLNLSVNSNRDLKHTRSDVHSYFNNTNPIIFDYHYKDDLHYAVAGYSLFNYPENQALVDSHSNGCIIDTIFKSPFEWTSMDTLGLFTVHLLSSLLS
jgi:hypothetical protein